MALTHPETEAADAAAQAFKARLHANCPAVPKSYRARECDWANAGYCRRCGRQMPALRPNAERRSMTHTEAEQCEIIQKLRKLAREFDDASEYYARYVGAHNELLTFESRRAAAQLRFVARLVANGTYNEHRGAIWLRAGWRIITAIGRANLT